MSISELKLLQILRNQSEQASNGIAELASTIAELSQRVALLSSHDQPRIQIQHQANRLILSRHRLSHNSPNSSQSMRQQLHKVASSLVEEVTSHLCSLHEEGKIGEVKFKVSWAESVLYNTIKLIRENGLSAQQIKELEEFMGKDLTKYLLLKHPRPRQRAPTEEEVGGGWEGEETDLISGSNARFDFDPKGNYHASIMKVLNYALALPDEKVAFGQEGDEVQLQALFHQEVGNLLRKVYSKEEVKVMLNYEKGAKEEKLELRSLEGAEMYRLLDGKGDGESADRKARYYQRCEDEEVRKFRLLANNGRGGRPFDLLTKPCEHDFQYAKKVRQYTVHQTERTLPGGIDRLSAHALSSGQVAKLLRDWCLQLEGNYDVMGRREPFRMEDGSQAFLPSAELSLLQQILSREKSRVDEQLAAIVEANCELQESASKKGFCERARHLSEFERTIGFFGAQMLMHHSDCLLAHLNSLIHGLLRAMRLFGFYLSMKSEGREIGIDQLACTYEQQKGRLETQKAKVPELLCLRAHLLRCRFHSQEEEVAAIYNELSRFNAHCPELLKILRTEGSLLSAGGLKMSILYRSTVMMEMAIGVQHPPNASHQLHELLAQLRESKFGFISELSTIACSDPKMQYFFDKTKKLPIGHRRVHPHQDSPFRRDIDSQRYRPWEQGDRHLKKQPFACGSTLDIQGQHVNNQGLKKYRGKFFSRVNLMENQLSLFTAVASSFPRVQILFLSNNHIHFIDSESIGAIASTLKELHLDSNGQLRQVNLTNCQRLTYLSISGCPMLQEVPASIGHCKNLQHLNLNFSGMFKTLPDELGSCTQLIRLSAVGTSLLTLPETVGNLVSLKELNVSRCKRLNSLPNSIATCSSLQCLNVKLTDISHLPDGLCKCSRLTKLNAESCPLKSLPFLPAVQNLRLSNCSSLSSVPSQGNKGLSILSLEGVTLQNYEFIGELPGLIELNLNRVKLNTLTLSIQTLEKLEALSLRDSGIEMIPLEIASCVCLRHLDLSGCRFTSFPVVLTQLNLSVLLLERFQGKQLPNQIGKCSSLSQLWLNNSAIQVLPPSIGQCKYLQILSLQGSMLKQLTIEVGKLTNLTYLDVSGTLVEELPPSLGDCTRLQYLKIENTRIARLPDQLVHCFSLELVSADSSPITFPADLARLPKLSFSMQEAMSNKALFSCEIEEGNEVYLNKAKVSNLSFSNLHVWSPSEVMHQLRVIWLKPNTLSAQLQATGSILKREFGMQMDGMEVTREYAENEMKIKIKSLTQERMELLALEEMVETILKTERYDAIMELIKEFVGTGYFFDAISVCIHVQKHSINKSLVRKVQKIISDLEKLYLSECS